MRDPGGDLTKGYQHDVPIHSRPFTKMAASAIQGKDWIDLESYRDYRGVKVIGAWRRLPEDRFGVATEVDVKQAFRALQPLRLAFIGLFSLLTVSAAAIVFSSSFIRRLRSRIDAVQQLGQYTLEKKIGEGGMGKVYKAKHALLQRPTVVKLMKMEAVNEETLCRFEREVQITSQLTHPNTIEIYHFGRTPEGIFYYAMEYLPGINLATLIEIEGAFLRCA